MATRVTLSQINSLPDLLPTDNFILMLGTVPGGGNANNLALKMTDCTLPGVTTDSFKVKLFGHTVTHRGMRNTANVLTATFVEDSTYDSTTVLYNWHSYVVNVQTGLSTGNKNSYTDSSATLYVFDQTGAVSASYQFIGLYINDIADSQLNGESTQVMKITAQFNYDYYIPSFSGGSISSSSLGYIFTPSSLTQFTNTNTQVQGLQNSSGIVNNLGGQYGSFNANGQSPISVTSILA